MTTTNPSSSTVFRFITAGSVDDGKSTLIGRLLYDSQTLLSDQLAQISKHTYTSGQLDLASLTDGLSAEREQGITIDVAYRYFNTAKRKFIIADTPGHEQYTRNMVTGASTAQAAIILIDATRLDFNQHPLQLLAQTKRHSALLKHLACPHIIVAINKLDLLDYAQEIFERIVSAYQELAKKIGIHHVHYLPISALHGENIVYPSQKMTWYQGPALLSLLESLPTENDTPLSQQFGYMAVQNVWRQDGSIQDAFRGYQGRLSSGQLKVGQRIRIEPNGYTSHILAIHSPDGLVEQIESGQTATLELADALDISRGDVIIDANSKPLIGQSVQATLCWLDEQPLNIHRKYLIKHGTKTIFAKIQQIEHLWDIHTLGQSNHAETFNMNDIGTITLKLQQAIVATPYCENRSCGAFILIDEINNHTVAAGMITHIQ